MVRLPPSRHTLHCGLRILNLRARDDPPLRRSCHHIGPASCRTRRLRAQRIRRCGLNATFRTRLQRCDGDWWPLSLRHSRVAHAAPLGTNTEICDTVRLAGWTEAGNRPEFSMISGTSAGALIAPFAFLGASHDPTLKDLFTDGIAERLLHVDGLNAIFGSGVFKTEPLKLLIAHYVDEDLLQLVAVQHRRGRRLFIVTTNIDAQRTAVWNLGAIAASDYSGRLQLFCAI